MPTSASNENQMTDFFAAIDDDRRGLAGRVTPAISATWIRFASRIALRTQVSDARRFRMEIGGAMPTNATPRGRREIGRYESSDQTDERRLSRRESRSLVFVARARRIVVLSRSASGIATASRIIARRNGALPCIGETGLTRTRVIFSLGILIVLVFSKYFLSREQ